MKPFPIGSLIAALVYKDELSPLYNATEILLFPSDGASPDEEITAMEFEKLCDDFAEELAMLLDKTDLGRYRPYPHNILINTLYWKNLLRKEGNRFVWRDDRTVDIGREVLAGDR